MHQISSAVVEGDAGCAALPAFADLLSSIGSCRRIQPCVKLAYRTSVRLGGDILTDSSSQSREPLQTTRERLYWTAAELFRARGFHATSMRDIAQAANIKAASIYHHYTSKDEILIDIMRKFLVDLIQGAESVGDGPESPTDRLAAIVERHVRMHAERVLEAVVADTELRALEGTYLAEVLALRSLYEVRVQSILRDGRESGEFRLSDIKVTSYMLLSMATGVGLWYRRDGRLPLDRVVEEHVGGVLRLAGADPGARHI